MNENGWMVVISFFLLSLVCAAGIAGMSAVVLGVALLMGY